MPDACWRIMSNASFRPATLVPPPAVYAVGLVLSWWLDRQWPLAMPYLASVRWLGWGLLVVSGCLMIWSAFTIWRHRTTVNPYRGASTLVQSGPYAFSRNPIYLADAILYAGIWLLMQSGWPLLLAPLVWAIMRFGVIRHEEAHLQAKFGSSYTDYCRRTARWLGRSKGK